MENKQSSRSNVRRRRGGVSAPKENTSSSSTRKPKTSTKTNKTFKSESLAVKYRPKSLDELVGQDSAVSQVRGFIATGNIPSAILIDGPTGTGKTTTAKIIASLVSTPEGHKGKNPDIREINAGTHGKIDDMRNLVRSTLNSPMFGTKRVVIIDEAHLLTGASASALLVPLEDSPEKTMWILATTNPERMLPTLLGRCMRITMQPVERRIMQNRLLEIAELEGISPKKVKGVKEAITTICDFSNGYMRSAISLLESVIYGHYSGENFDKQSVINKYITTSDVDIDLKSQAFVLATMNNDMKAAIKIMYDVGNARAMASSISFLLDCIVRSQVGKLKYKPYIFQLYTNKSKEFARPSLSSLVRLQSYITEANITFNQTAVPPEAVLQMQLVKYFETKE